MKNLLQKLSLLKDVVVKTETMKVVARGQYINPYLSFFGINKIKYHLGFKNNSLYFDFSEKSVYDSLKYGDTVSVTYQQKRSKNKILSVNKYYLVV